MMLLRQNENRKNGDEMKKIFSFIHGKIVNSRLWYNVYYKHTKEHKQNLENTYNRALKRRKEIIGK